MLLGVAVVVVVVVVVGDAVDPATVGEALMVS